jgi:Zn-dependent protease with chaperone function
MNLIPQKTGDSPPRLVSRTDAILNHMVTLASLSVIALQAAFIAPVAEVALLAGAGLAALSWRKRNKANEGAPQDSLRRQKNTQIYFPSFSSDREKFSASFLGCLHPRLLEHTDRIMRAAGLKSTPALAISDGSMGCAVDSRANGGNAAIELSQGMMCTQNTGGIIGVLAHEAMHLALRHKAAQADADARIDLSKQMKWGVLASAAFNASASPLLTIAAGGALVYCAEKLQDTLEKIRKRHNETICDRGAALLTGGGQELGTLLAETENRALQSSPENAADILKKQKRSHPPTPWRAQNLARVENTHAAWCAAQRAKFAPAFDRT